MVLGLPDGDARRRVAVDTRGARCPLARLVLVLAAMTVTESGSRALSGVVRERFGTIALTILRTVLAAGGLLLLTLAQTWSMIIVAAAVLGAGLGLLGAAVNTEADALRT